MAKKNKSVLTIRIDGELDDLLSDICKKNRMTKASLIRAYLDMAKYLYIDNNSLKSLNHNDLILLKLGFFSSLLSKYEEEIQIDIGVELAQFINDLARLQGQIENIEYKLDLCEHLGFFPKFIDKEDYILISNKFGPQKFVEAFIYKLILMGDEQDFDKAWTNESLAGSSKARSAYKQKVNPIERSAEHYSFEFAKITANESE